MKRACVLIGQEQILSPYSRSGDVSFSRFFDVLSYYRFDWEVRDVLSSLDEASAFDLIVLGGPLKPLPDEMCKVLREFVGRGGAMLLTGQAGGDRSTLGRRYRTNLNSLFPGLRFCDNAIYYPTQMESSDNLDLEYPIPEIPMRAFYQQTDDGERDELLFRYVSGCTFLFDRRWFHPYMSVDGGMQDGLRASYHLEVEYGDTLTTEHESDADQKVQGEILASLGYGDGRLFVTGSTMMFEDAAIKRSVHEYQKQRIDDNEALLLSFLMGISTPDDELQHRMSRPQRHRLLQGYPMRPVMEEVKRLSTSSSSLWLPPRRGTFDPETTSLPGQHRQALVGILPHSYCNPTVQGCGFCTFPQEKMQRSKIPLLVDRVLREMDAYAEVCEAQVGSAVPAVYFGGATANLTPPEHFEPLLRRVGELFDLSAPDVEITLEGVPRYFQLKEYALMRMMREHFPNASLRISMGVQTLDDARLASMGRAGFGDARVFQEVVEMAHQLGFAASCDMLINLPGQTSAEIVADLEGVASMGFDQICMYHLVLFEGLGTPWSKDAAMLDALPTNSRAFAHWRVGRDCLLRLGYHQSSLTNFEREGGPRFLYEDLGYQPHLYDLLGFGPNAISLAFDSAFRHGHKWMNPRLADDYLRLLPREEEIRELFERRREERRLGIRPRSSIMLASQRKAFRYRPLDTQILYLTRSIARLGISLEEYRAHFGRGCEEMFGWAIEAAMERGLCQRRGTHLALTERGMFFADSLAGLLAWPRIGQRHLPSSQIELPERTQKTMDKHRYPRRFHDPNEALYGGMG